MDRYAYNNTGLIVILIIILAYKVISYMIKLILAATASPSGKKNKKDKTEEAQQPSGSHI